MEHKRGHKAISREEIRTLNGQKVKCFSQQELSRAMCKTHNICLRSSRNDFIANIPVYLQLPEMGHLQSTPPEQLCT